ncbi:hypothetical protein PEBR_41116 [Penicillium brasilianum]|uniref:Uncharacterized protein n=1 Tax=Penicillium brasilianum TaxID=104259 RepID=A0A1S9R8R2_PENBI|nr:hypothetical protein PEBR_41116 [Penicillium brasilianum]
MHFPLTTLFSSVLFAILASSQVVSLDKNLRTCDDRFGIPSEVPGGFSNVDCDGENVKEAENLIQVPRAEILGVTRQVVAGEKLVFFVVQDEVVYRIPILRQLNGAVEVLEEQICRDVSHRRF